MAELNRLKASVYRATEPSGDDEGDPTAMVDINIILQEHPNLMVEAVKAIKARIKDKNEKVQIIALDLLDQCMQSNGIQLQMHVMKKVLPRVLKFANPSKRECERTCQQKSAALIKTWAALYGTDGRMKDYENANRELTRAEEKLQLQRTAAARMQVSAQAARGEEPVFPRLGERPGRAPGGGGQPHAGRSLSPNTSDYPPNDGDMGIPPQMPPVDVEQIKVLMLVLTVVMLVLTVRMSC